MKLRLSILFLCLLSGSFSIKLLTSERFEEKNFRVALYDLKENEEATILAETEKFPWFQQDQVCNEASLLSTQVVNGVSYIFANEKAEKPFNNTMYTIKVDSEQNQLSMKRTCEWNSSLQIAGGLNQYKDKIYFFSTEEQVGDTYQNVNLCYFLNILDPTTCTIIEKKKVKIPFIYPWNTCYSHRNECPMDGNTFYMLESVSDRDRSVNRSIYSYNLDTHEQKKVVDLQIEGNFSNWIEPTLRVFENHLFVQLSVLVETPERIRKTIVYDVDLKTLKVKHIEAFEEEYKWFYKKFDKIAYYQSQKRIFHLSYSGYPPLKSYKMDNTEYIYFKMKDIFSLEVPVAILELYM